MPSVVDVQEGVLDISGASGGTSGSVTISSTNADNAAVLYTIRDGDDTTRMARYQVKMRIRAGTTSTNIDWECNTQSFRNSLIVAWTVIEWDSDQLDDVAIYDTIDPNADPFDVTLSPAITEARTVVFTNGLTSITTGNAGETWACYHTSTTNLRIDYHSSGSPPSAGEWDITAQVVTFASGVANQQQGSINVTSAEGASDTATITSVDTGKSGVLHAGVVTGAVDFSRSFSRVTLTNGTTVTLDRNTTPSVVTVEGRFQVLEAEDDDFTTYGTSNTTGLTGDVDITSSNHTLSKGAVMSGTANWPNGYNTTNNEPTDSQRFTAKLEASGDTLAIDRENSTGTLEFGYYVHEFEGTAAATANPKGPLGHPLHGPLGGPV